MESSDNFQFEGLRRVVWYDDMIALIEKLSAILHTDVFTVAHHTVMSSNGEKGAS